MTRVLRSLAMITALLTPAAALAQQPTIKIGTIFAMTGPVAAWGNSAAEGISFAVEEVNKAGGLDVKGTKYKLELISYDDQLKAAEAVAAYTRLVERDKAKYVFTMISASHLAIKPMIEGDDVFALTAAISDKAIEADTKHTVRIQSLVRDYLPGMVKWAKANVPGDRIALLYPNDESGWVFEKMTTEQTGKVGYNVVSKELAERSLKDFQPVLTRILATNPDLIDLGPTSSGTAGLIVRQARELGYKKAFIVLGGGGARDIVAAAGPEVTEGMVHMVYADPKAPVYQPLAERYREKFKQLPNELIVNYYDGAVALFKAIQLAGDPNNAIKVRESFGKVFPMKSLLGDSLTFGGKDTLGVDAQVYPTNYIAVVKNGESVVVGKTN
jgi:branched-chain amino acid transport system substrate-binding protein